MQLNRIIQGDALEVLKTLPEGSVNCCITSPPYFGLRDYSRDGQIGLETTPEDYVRKLMDVFREVKRVLKDDGTLWLNLGDSYVGGGFGVSKDENYDLGKQCTNRGTADFETRKKLGKLKAKIDGLKSKDLIGIPWRVAFALQADGWYLRQDIIWAKPNPMPESVTDRCTKSHEYIFLLSKKPKYYFDNEAIKEKSVGDDPRMIDGFVPKSVNGKHANDKQNSSNRKKYKPTEAGGGTSMVNHNGYFKADGSPIGTAGKRNKRDVWTITVSSFAEAHFATFPKALIEPMVLAGCPKGGAILDPFMGAGTTAVVAKRNNRKYLGIELNGDYIKIAAERLKGITSSMF